MPPNIQNANAAGTGFTTWYTSMPPITRTYATLVFAVTAINYLGILSAGQLALIWPLVFQKLEVGAMVCKVLAYRNNRCFMWSTMLLIGLLCAPLVTDHYVSIQISNLYTCCVCDERQCIHCLHLNQSSVVPNICLDARDVGESKHPAFLRPGKPIQSLCTQLLQLT